MVKKFYMYSVWDGKYVLKTEELQSKLLNQNWLLLATCDTICGFTCLEKRASDFPWLGLYILPKDFIKAKWLQKLSCFVRNLLFYIWISLMCKGQPICLLSIPRNSHALDTGQINRAGWKPAQAAGGGQQLLYGNGCSQQQRKAQSAAIWLNLFLLYFVLPMPSQLSLYLPEEEDRRSVELIFTSLSGADLHVTQWS